MGTKVKVGLFGIGLDTYWPQFDGLLEKLTQYQNQIHKRINGFGVEVADAGMVDDPSKAIKAAEYLKSEDVEIVFLYVSTYALSSTVFTGCSESEGSDSDPKSPTCPSVRLSNF
jgi:L-arabinose isomerase